MFNPCRIPTLVVEAPVLTYPRPRLRVRPGAADLGGNRADKRLSRCITPSTRRPQCRPPPSATESTQCRWTRSPNRRPRRICCRAARPGDQIAAHQDCPWLRQAAVTGRAESHRPANGLRPGVAEHRRTVVPARRRSHTRTKGAADRSPATACRGTPSPRTPPATRKLLVRCSPLDRTNKSTSGMAGWYR